MGNGEEDCFVATLLAMMGVKKLLIGMSMVKGLNLMMSMRSYG